jgi:SWI/SNF-related matrix-associated actin-dependent regulator 1 of chromatin subfamily A
MNLFPYQEEGARFLASRKRALLADGPRVGKTLQTVAAADMIGAERILVICPSIARGVWARHFKEVSLWGHTITVLDKSATSAAGTGVFILHMDGSRNPEIFARVMAHRWDLMILDECHFLKEPTSQRTRQVLSANGFASMADRIWFLSGTPMLNNPLELWTMLSTIGVWKSSIADFQARFCTGYLGDYGFKVTGMKNVEELKSLLGKVMLRRTYHQMFPSTAAPTWREIELDPAMNLHCGEVRFERALEELQEYENANLKHNMRFAKAIAKFAANPDAPMKDFISKEDFALLNKLSAWAKIKPMGAWLAENLRNETLDKVVVFCHHARLVHHLNNGLREFRSRALYGGTDENDRQRFIDEFESKSLHRVLICQDQVASTAIDLCGANSLVFAELSNVPEVNAQCAMRVQGPRQKRPVNIYVARMKGTMDEAVTKILERKTRMITQLFDV